METAYKLVDVIAECASHQPDEFKPELGTDLGIAARDYAEAVAHMQHSQRILAREVANSVDAGMSVAEAARIAGVQRHTVYSWCFEAKR